MMGKSQPSAKMHMCASLHTCLACSKHICKKPNMCGKKTILFSSNIPTCVKTHMCEKKNTVDLHFYEVAQTKHMWLLPNTYQIQRYVMWKTHMFVKSKHVCVFSYRWCYFLCSQLYLNFLYLIWYIISIYIISDAYMQYQTSKTLSK